MAKPSSAFTFQHASLTLLSSPEGTITHACTHSKAPWEREPRRQSLSLLTSVVMVTGPKWAQCWNVFHGLLCVAELLSVVMQVRRQPSVLVRALTGCCYSLIIMWLIYLYRTGKKVCNMFLMNHINRHARHCRFLAS